MKYAQFLRVRRQLASLALAVSNIACIGIKGKGDSDADHAAIVGNVVAICDIDDERLDAKANQKV